MNGAVRQSRATSSIRSAGLWPGVLAGRPDWARVAACVRGPLLTLTAAVLLDVLRREQVGLLSPFPVLLLTIVYAAYTAGLWPALVSVAVTVLDALHFFARPGLPLRYGPDAAASLLVVSAVALLVAIAVSRLRERVLTAEALALGRSEAEGLARHFGILEQAGLILTSARDPEVAFRDLARLLSPTLADWCALHVADEGERLRCVAVAHRDPTRDVVVRALADYGERTLPFGALAPEPLVAPVTEALVRAASADEEHLKMYRALAPTEVLRLPVGDPRRPQGVVTLVMAGDSGRRFHAADVLLAQEVAQAAGLALENVRLRGERKALEHRARLVFEAHPQPMWIFDVDTLRLLAVNDAAIEHYGYPRDEFLQMTILDLLAPEDPGLLAGLERRLPIRGEAALALHRRRDGSVVDMELVSHELTMEGRRARLVLATDVSERTRIRAALHESEEHLRQSQRGEALGRIAGGVAHDFNNLLTTIRGFGEMLLRELPEDDRRRHDVQRIGQAAERGALLTRQLQSLGRHQAQAPVPVSLNPIVLAMEPLVRQLAGADVELELRLAEGVGRVLADPAQMEHLIVNLVLGACEAMPAGGRLTIETADRRISGATPGRSVRPGRYVMLAVGDSSGDDREPRGVLGRSILFGIVRQHGGVVRVASESGQGTVVKVYLPRLDETAEPEPEPMSAWRGSETVLVAEDQEGVRDLTRKVLAGLGYTVLTARHGRDALLAAEEHGAELALLVTDVVMPEMNGRELAERLETTRPGLKVLFMSGYADDEILRRGISEREVAFLRKPFAAEELARRVRALLDER